MSKFDDIPQFPQPHYRTRVPWRSIERELADHAEYMQLDLEPDYQRGHVWSPDQKQAYLEYCLRGGEVARTIVWNAPTWVENTPGPMELVDGLQRLTAVREFLRGEVQPFGLRYKCTDRLPLNQCYFEFQVVSLERAGVLELYLNINAGGTPHSAEEIERVRGLLRGAVS